MTDRWIDLIAASYGMPRIVLLRELRSMLNLAREVAKVIAAQEQREAAEEAEARERKAQQEAEMRSYLSELKREQDALRTEQQG